jgi:hypothetical protein
MNKIVNRFLKYIHKPANEFGFLVLSLRKERTNLPAHLYIDDNGTWINLGDKKIILFEPNNSGNGYLEKVLPMSIEDSPKILVEHGKIDLSSFEINQLKEFVKKNKDHLLRFAEGKIDHRDFFEIIENIMQPRNDSGV